MSMLLSFDWAKSGNIGIYIGEKLQINANRVFLTNEWSHNFGKCIFDPFKEKNWLKHLWKSISCKAFAIGMHHQKAFSQSLKIAFCPSLPYCLWGCLHELCGNHFETKLSSISFLQKKCLEILFLTILLTKLGKAGQLNRGQKNIMVSWHCWKVFACNPWKASEFC